MLFSLNHCQLQHGEGMIHQQNSKSCKLYRWALDSLSMLSYCDHLSFISLKCTSKSDVFHQCCGFLYSLSYFIVYPRPGHGPQWHSGVELIVWLICVRVWRQRLSSIAQCWRQELKLWCQVVLMTGKFKVARWSGWREFIPNKCVESEAVKSQHINHFDI